MSTQPEIGAEHGSGNQTHDTPKLEPVALAQLIASVTLALCTLIVATAVSIGLAHGLTHGLTHAAIVPGADPAPFAMTLPPTDCDA
jgi:hypothetical protein